MKKYKFETIEEYYKHMRANNRKWYSNPDNKEKKKEYQRKRYFQNREAILEKNRQRYYEKKLQKQSEHI